MGDDEPDDENGEQSAQAQEGEPGRAEDIQAVAEEPLKTVASFLMSERIAEHDKERMLADGSRGRVSVKEKLAEMKQKISNQKMPEKPEVTKNKGKEESLQEGAMEANEPKKEQNTEEMDVMKQFMELMGQQGMKELSQMKVKSEQQKKEPEKSKTKSQEASL